MAFQVEIISEEIIKPSSPTPPHLKEHKFSILDQIIPPTHAPMIFFYHLDLLDSNTTNHHQQTRTSRLLKESLAKTLTIYYPLAGRIKDNSSIDCNDKGVHFIEARVNSQLSDIVTQDLQYNVEQLRQLVPVLHDSSKMVSAVQINLFACGGIAIAICVSHKAADGASQMAFIQSWAAMCRGESASHVKQPRFDLASFFPPADYLSMATNAEDNHTTCKEEAVTKRIVFDKEKIASLKAEIARSELNEDAATRVEAVWAFLWKQFVDIVKKKNADSEIFTAYLSVNGRPRASPHNIIDPEQAFGNFSLISRALCSFSDDGHGQMHYLAHLLHKAIKKIDGDYIKQLQLDFGNYLVDWQKPIEHESPCHLTSWFGFPMYEIDFGWGKPTRFCTVLPFKNLVILMNTPCGEGIEAWVSLPQDEMNMLEI